MPIRTGNIATGGDFFDREQERQDLWRYLEGNHINLSGPRRLGKSSLLKRLAEEAPDKGLHPRYIDLQGLDSADAFLAALDAAFPDASLQGHLKSASGAIKNWLARINKLDIKVAGSGGAIELQHPPTAAWGIQALALQTRLSSAPILILVDEFSVFLEKLIHRDRAEAEALLAWLRRWRQTDPVCRFLFSGSVGINALLEQHRFSTWMNDCHEFTLGPFRRPDAITMLTNLAQRETWQLPQETASHLCDVVGWLSPFYLCLLLDESLKAGRDRMLEQSGSPKDLLTEDIDDAYDRLLAARSRFVHWHQRLQRDLQEPDLGLTLAILRALAKSDTGLTRKQLLSRLSRLEADGQKRSDRLSAQLLYLEENGYVGQNGEHIAFLSFLLRDYWRRNHAD